MNSKEEPVVIPVPKDFSVNVIVPALHRNRTPIPFQLYTVTYHFHISQQDIGKIQMSFYPKGFLEIGQSMHLCHFL